MAIFGINWKGTQGALGDFDVLEMVEGLPGYDHFVKTHRVVHVWFVLLSVRILCVHAVSQSCPTLSDSIDWSPPVPLSIGLSRQEYWSRLQLPTGIDPMSLEPPALVGRFFTTGTPGKPYVC